MSDVLILGGTRNLGHFTALEMLGAGHRVAILNRGITPDELPAEIERMRADRGDPASLQSAIGGRSFDVVVDTTTYAGREARDAIDLFSGRTGRYIFISTGQVYLVRQNLPAPFREEDYTGPVIGKPDNRADLEAWRYGVEKRDAEDAFAIAHRESGFPVITLRLPMVASERDHYGRIQAYIARMLDGGPLLIPEEAGLPLRHVYVADVARLIVDLVGNHPRRGVAYNISYGASTSLAELLSMLADQVAPSIEIRKIRRDELERAKLLPHCSPFSGKWMSELDNRRSLRDLKRLRYTPPEEYLPSLVADYRNRWQRRGLVPNGYEQRGAELAFASSRRG